MTCFEKDSVESGHGWSITRTQRAWSSDLTTPLALAALMLTLSFFGEPLLGYLAYYRPAILEGEWWRLYSGHFVHFGWRHTLMNVGGLLLLVLICRGCLTSREWLTGLALLPAAAGLGLLLFERELTGYVGFSGALHGFFLYGLGRLALSGDRLAGLCLLILIAKLVWEQINGPLSASEAALEAPIIVTAHAIDAVTAAIWLVGAEYFRRWA